MVAKLLVQFVTELGQLGSPLVAILDLFQSLELLPHLAAKLFDDFLDLRRFLVGEFQLFLNLLSSKQSEEAVAAAEPTARTAALLRLVGRIADCGHGQRQRQHHQNFCAFHVSLHSNQGKITPGVSTPGTQLTQLSRIWKGKPY